MLYRKGLVLLGFMVGVFGVYAQDAVVKKSLEAVRIPGSPVIDGKLDDAVWLTAPVAKDFVQNRPAPGATPSQRSEIKVLYDDESVYVGAYLYDNAADSILHQLSQRDRLENTDWFGVWFSCFQDGINAFEFFVTPDGVQWDAQVSTFGEDNNWNAVWQCNTSIQEDGWIAEFKIPYSAIRFPSAEEQTWDINFTRVIRRHREQSFWQHVDPEVAGFINQSGELKGIKNIDPPVRLFFYPYASAYLESSPDGEGGTNTGSSYNGGMDIKFGLTDAFTLDATLIPDFGQVQSDAQVLNLSPFEVFFQEQRQFFTEGTELFNKGGLFYSRRVGGYPVNADLAYDSLTDEEEIESLPSQTRLINAVKVSGRNANGLGLGVFNAVTNQEVATIRNTETGERREVEVSPLTNYNIVVADQNLPNNSYFTIINTNVLRDGATYDANVTGINFELRDKPNRFSVSGNAAYNFKTNFGDEATDDGYTWSLSVDKIDGNLNFGAFHNVESDTYDPNDLGFLSNPNERFTFAYVRYNIFEPFGRFNNLWSNVNFFHGMLYQPNEVTFYGFDGEIGLNTRKFFSFGGGFEGQPMTERDFFEPRRDGYFQNIPAYYGGRVWCSSDYRKRLAVDARTWQFYSTQEGRGSYNFRIAPRFRVNDRLFFSYVYSWQNAINDEGYGFAGNHPDDTVVEAYDDKVIFSRRDIISHTQVLDARYIFTNRMGLTCRLRHYWSRLESKDFLELQEDGSVLDSDFPGFREDGSSLVDQSFNAFNVDLVYTWVFSPGSELRVVWKNAILTNMDADQRLPDTGWDNFRNTIETPGTNSLSIRVLYFIDYLTLKRRQKLIQN